MKSWVSSGLSAIWADVLRVRWALIVLVLVALAARSQSITTPMYSIDSYVSRDDPTLLTSILSNGRWGLVALLWLREKFGYAGMDVIPSALILSIALFTCAGFLYARVLLTRFDGVELLMFVALFTLHPFNTEFYTFSDTTLAITLSIFLAAAGLACASATARPGSGAAIGGILMLAALSIYQLAIVHLVIVSLLTAIERVAGLYPAQPGQRRLRQIVATPPVRALLVITAIAIVSFIITLILHHFFGTTAGVPANQSRVPDISEVPDFKKKAAALSAAFLIVLTPPPGIMPPIASLLLIGILTLAVVTILLAILRRSGIGWAFAASGLLAAAAVSSVIVPVMANFVWLAPRVLSPFSIFVAGVATLGWRYTHVSWIRCVLTVALAAVSLSYVGGSNRILYDQRRVNLWDMQEANRILARLESNPRFGDLHALVMVDGDWRRSAPLATVFRDMNISAFASKYSKLGLVEQATGFRFAAPSQVELETGQAYCSDAGVWPVADSVVIIGNLGIVCLRRP